MASCLAALMNARWRLSELCFLRTEHILSERGQIRVEQGKGRKDRYTVLSPRLLEQLRAYWRVYRPFSEIGRTLGLSDDAARMRVERAVEKLRGKQGIWQRSLAVLARLSGGGFSMLPFSVVTDTVECLGR